MLPAALEANVQAELDAGSAANQRPRFRAGRTARPTRPAGSRPTRSQALGSSGQNVDGSVRRIGTAYDDIGRVRTVTDYSDTTGSAAVNQVKYQYNGWNQVYREYQEHAGTVDASSLFVEYDYVAGATSGVAKYVRLDQVKYPNGRQVHYDYGTTGATDDIMSRLATIGDGTNTEAAYSYLGAGKIVAEDYVEAGVRLDYAHDNLAGLDRFGKSANTAADHGRIASATTGEALRRRRCIGCNVALAII
jgi:hypothetical protein